MEFDLLFEYLMELLTFVKPVSSLVSDWFQAMFMNIREFEMVFFIFVSFAIIGFFVSMFDRFSGS